MPGPLSPRAALDRDLDVDVAVVGAGYTGLWTAYYLRRRDPALRIAVLEREIAGFGASGRNGGWCSATFAASLGQVAAAAGRGGAIALQRALFGTVEEVGRVCARERLDVHWAADGVLRMARGPAQETRLRRGLAQWRAFGFGPADVRWLDADEARAMVPATGCLGGVYLRHGATLHPARLARGLADRLAADGVAIFERTPVRSISAGRVDTPGGRVRAPVVVRATEGYTAGLPGLRRRLAPVYSLMVATEPVPEPVWRAMGWAPNRCGFTDARHLLVYAQRTADDRIAFGGRGAPYHYGSAVRSAFDSRPEVFRALRASLVEMFPALSDTALAHHWGGPLGVPRDWFPAVGFDPVSGLAEAGGYVGQGVAAANLAGRTLADLISRADTELTRLPWVGHRSRRWAPEPLRWLGVNAGIAVMSSADRAEARTGRPARRAALFERLTRR